MAVDRRPETWIYCPIVGMDLPSSAKIGFPSYDRRFSVGVLGGERKEKALAKRERPEIALVGNAERGRTPRRPDGGRSLPPSPGEGAVTSHVVPQREPRSDGTEGRRERAERRCHVARSGAWILVPSVALD